MKSSNLILGIALAISLPVSLFLLANQSFDLRIGAFDSDEPRYIEVTNVKSDSFDVTWYTQKETIGGIQLAGDTRAPDLDTEALSYHQITVANLKPSTKYEFQLIVDGRDYFAGTTTFSATTARNSLSSGGKLIYGQVFDLTGTSALNQGFVDIVFTNGTLRSQPISAKLNIAGGYQLNTAGLLDNSLTSAFSLNSPNMSVEISVRHPDTDKVTKIYTLNTGFIQLPNMYPGDVQFDVIPGIDGT